MISLSHISLDLFYKKLEYKLEHELVGELAHLKMIPKGRDLYPNKNDNPRQSAVLISFYQQDNELYFPLIKRTKSNGVHSGQMALPGGKVENSDKNLIHTALREAEEEVGLKQSNIQVIGTLSQIYIGVTNIMVQPVVGFMNSKPDFTPQLSEVEGIYVVKLSELLNPENKRCEIWEIRGEQIEVPFYLLNGKKVWGATAMILSELEALLSKP